MKMQSVFANAKFCRNISHSAIFHPAPQSSREDFFNLPTKNEVLIWLFGSWKLSALLFPVIFSSCVFQM